MKTGDFSELVDAAGKPIIIYDPATGRDVNGLWVRDPVPQQPDSGQPDQCDGEGDVAVLPGPQLHDAGRRAVAAATSATPSTSTRTSSGTGSARSTTTSAATTASSSAGPRTSATRCATPPRSAAARRRTASCRCSARNARSSATGCTSSAPARCSTCAAATPTTSSGSQSDYAFGFDATQLGWPASLVSQLPAASVGGMFPVFTYDQFVSLSRGSAPNTNKIYSIQPNVSLTRGAHNIRSGLDLRLHQRLQRQLRQRRRARSISPAPSPAARSTAPATLEGNAFASFLLGAPIGRQGAGQPVPALLLELRRALDPGRLAGHQQADPEPRLPLGLQRPGPRGSRTGSTTRSTRPSSTRFPRRSGSR